VELPGQVIQVDISIYTGPLPRYHVHSKACLHLLDSLIIARERERERERDVYINMHIYIYIYIYIHIYLYIYVYTPPPFLGWADACVERGQGPVRCRASWIGANLAEGGKFKGGHAGAGGGGVRGGDGG